MTSIKDGAFRFYSNSWIQKRSVQYDAETAVSSVWWHVVMPFGGFFPQSGQKRGEKKYPHSASALCSQFCFAPLIEAKCHMEETQHIMNPLKGEGMKTTSSTVRQNKKTFMGSKNQMVILLKA